MNKYLVRSDGQDIFLIKYIRPSAANSEWAGSGFNEDDRDAIGPLMGEIFSNSSGSMAVFGTHAHSLKRAAELSRKILKYQSSIIRHPV